MTDAQLARIEALTNEGPLPYTEAALLAEETKRLRGLVKAGEYASGPYAACAVCPWCDCEEPEKERGRRHFDDCPASALTEA